MSGKNKIEALFPFNFSEMNSQTSIFAPLDLKIYMEAHRKNIQTFNQAKQKLIESLQTAGKIHAELLSDWLENSTNLTRAGSTEGKPEDKIVKQTEISQKAYEKAVKNFKEMADFTCETSKDFSDLFQKRMTAALNEFRESLDQAADTVKKAA